MVPPILSLLDQESHSDQIRQTNFSLVGREETDVVVADVVGDLLIFDSSPIKSKLQTTVASSGRTQNNDERSTKLKTILSNAFEDHVNGEKYLVRSKATTNEQQLTKQLVVGHVVVQDNSRAVVVNNGSYSSLSGGCSEKILNSKTDDCDCKKCLNEELLRVKREIFFMYKQQQQVPPPPHHHRHLHTYSSSSNSLPTSSSSSFASSKHPHHHPLLVNGAEIVEEEEFEDELKTSHFVIDVESPFPSSLRHQRTKFSYEDQSRTNKATKSHSKRSSGVETKLNSLLTSCNGADQNEQLAGNEYTRLMTQAQGTTTDGRPASRLLSTTSSNSIAIPAASQPKKKPNIIENELFVGQDEEEELVLGPKRYSWSAGGCGRIQTQDKTDQTTIEGNEATSLLLNSFSTSETTPVKKKLIRNSKQMRVIKAGSGGGGGGGGGTSGEDVVVDGTGKGGGQQSVSPNSHRMKRFEQFLKSLVGKRPSSSGSTSSNNSSSQHSQKNGSTESKILSTNQSIPPTLQIESSEVSTLLLL